LNEQRTAEHNHEHWYVHELLARYAEIERSSGNAAQTYPEVAAHLSRCESCRAALSDMMADDAGGVMLRRITADDLLFLRRPNLAHHAVGPGSGGPSFSIHIALPSLDLHGGPAIPGVVARSGVERGFGPTQPGGRLLLFDTVSVEGEDIQVMLTLHSGAIPDRYTIVGDLVGESLPPLLKARLHVGDEVYFSEVEGGLVQFEDVAFVEDAESVMITFETPAWSA
jgi:hypothetical protein